MLLKGYRIYYTTILHIKTTNLSIGCPAGSPLSSSRFSLVVRPALPCRPADLFILMLSALALSDLI